MPTKTKSSTIHLSIAVGEGIPAFTEVATLIDIFRSTVQKHGARSAISAPQLELSYSELDKRTDAKAAWLISRGVTSGSLVGLWLARGIPYHEWSLAIMKAGAAFVPFDSDAPAERTAIASEEAGLFCMLIDDATKSRAVSLPCESWLVSHIDPSEITGLPAEISPGNPAYVIFTSGSTGKPKGVKVLHRNAAHWAQAENSLLKIQSTDIVLQGFSPSFDMAIEETWLAFLAGAKLEVLLEPLGQNLDTIPALIRSKGITVLHTVPTLARLLTPPLPPLRILNLGGEACPESVAKQWTGKGIQVFNTYGPTEATISASGKELLPGLPVTLGKMLPNYIGFVMSDDGTIAAQGEAGELWIGGPSIAAGYVNRPDLTSERFLACPFPEWKVRFPVLYRSGDLVILNSHEELEFRGRIDHQVKIRGYRVELSEIEAVIERDGEARFAVVVPAPGSELNPRLICFLVPTKTFNADHLRSMLKSQLPSYMIPSAFFPLDELPRLPSGKIDRKKLPLQLAERTASQPALVETLGRLPKDQVLLLESLRKIFPGVALTPENDFFEDLGGDSLTAAMWVSLLRSHPEFAAISMRQIYEGRTIAAIAAFAAIAKAGNPGGELSAAAEAENPAVGPQERGFGWAVPLAQMLSLVIVYSLLGLLITSPYLAYAYVRDEWDSIALASVAAMAAMVATPPLVMLITIAAKWLLLGKLKEGDYPVHGFYYFRYWFVRALVDLLPARYFAGTPLYVTFWRSLGCEIGHSVCLGRLDIGAPDLVTIGDYSSIGSSTVFANANVENGILKLRRITIGRDSYVGSSAVLAGGATVPDRAEIGNLSYLQAESAVQRGERWEGSPACKAGEATAAAPIIAKASLARKIGLQLGYILLSSTFPIFSLLPFLPALILLRELDESAMDWDFRYLVFSPLCALSYILLFASLLLASKWLVLGRVKEGKYSVYSGLYLRKWYVDQLFELSLDTLHSLFATLYLPPLYRALGAKVGNRTEISTANSVTFDLLEVHEESFIGDNVMLGDPEIRHGWMHLKKTVVGKRCFLGNSALLPDGIRMPDASLLGVLSCAPKPNDPRLISGSSWIGTPPIPLPRRAVGQGFSEQLTFRPSRLRRLSRLIIEGIRILFPPTLMFVAFVVLITVSLQLWELSSFWLLAVCFPFLYLGTVGLPIFLFVVALKWICVGRYERGTYPMWSFFVWRTEAITAIYEATAVPLLLAPLTGTPFLTPLLRLLGVKVGKHCFLDTTDFTEFDLARVGSGVSLNRGSGLQTHLFEDRVMKLGPVTVETGASIGCQSVVLYDSVIGAGCNVQPLTLVMKGEHLPALSNWVGSPAEMEVRARKTKTTCA